MNTSYEQHIKNNQQVELYDKVNSASPHELIHMLFQGAKTEIKSAIIKIQHNNIPQKGLHISKAIRIVLGLKDAVNTEADKELAKNLIHTYDNVSAMLFDANLHNDIKKLERCYFHINELSEAWSQIKPQVEGA